MTMSISPGARLAPFAAPELKAQAVRRFPRFSLVLHWLTAVLVLLMFCSGVLMKQIGEGPTADMLYTLHKMAGVCLLALVMLRLGYRVAMHVAGRWRRGAGSHVVHGVLYACLILVPLLGWAGISDYGARGVYFGLALPAIWPEGAGYADWLFKSHAVLAFSLIGFVAIHIGIALGAYIQRGAKMQPQGAKNASPAQVDMR